MLDTALEKVEVQEPLKGRLLASKAWLLGRLGARNPHVKQLAHQALSLISDKDIQSLSTCYILLGAIHDDAAEFEIAKAYFEKDWKLHDSESGEAANASCNLALIMCQIDQYEEAQVHIDLALDYFKRRNNIGKILQLTNVQAQLYINLRKYLKAKLILGDSLSLKYPQKFQHFIPMLENHLARVYAATGDTQRAIYLGQKLLQQNDSNPWVGAKALLLLGDIEAHHDPQKAFWFYLESLERIKHTESAPGILLRLVCLASVLEDSKLATRIYRYCLDHKNQMSSSDIERFETLRNHTQDTAANDWLDLQPHEVATLCIYESKLYKEMAQSGITD